MYDESMMNEYQIKQSFVYLYKSFCYSFYENTQKMEDLVIRSLHTWNG